MKETTVSDVQRINVIVLVVGSLLALFIMREFKYLFSFAVASAIMTLNFKFLRKMIESGLSKPVVRKSNLIIGLPVKFLVLVGLITVVVVFGDIDILFFLAGLSTVFISLVINQIAIVLRPAEKKEAERWDMT